MGIIDGIPQPMSTKQPNFSMWVTRAGKTSPGVQCDKNSCQHCSCACRRERIASGTPSVSVVSSCTWKQTGFPAFAISAISLVVPSAMPIAPSSRGIMPRICGNSTMRLCAASQTMARASKICFRCMAACNAATLCRAVWFSMVCSRMPSGKYVVILTSHCFFCQAGCFFTVYDEHKGTGQKKHPPASGGFCFLLL